jgi:hypothetical protein
MDNQADFASASFVLEKALRLLEIDAIIRIHSGLRFVKRHVALQEPSLCRAHSLSAATPCRSPATPPAMPGGSLPAGGTRAPMPAERRASRAAFAQGLAGRKSRRMEWAKVERMEYFQGDPATAGC